MSNLLKRASSFRTNQAKAGNTGLMLACEVARHMVEHKDWRPAARLIKGLKHTPADQSKMRVLVGHALEGVSYKKDDTHAEGGIFTLKDARLSNKIALMDEAVEAGLSFRSKELHDSLRPCTKKKEFDMDAYIKRVQKKLADEGVDIPVFIGRMKAAEPVHNPGEI